MQTSLPSQETMYEALLKKDSRFEGIFFVAVKTTGIFCRPTCTARKPKKENVEFFPSIEEAIQKGYRACKVCHPLEYQGEIPTWIQSILDEIQTNPYAQLKDQDLRERGIEPNRLRRWFKKHYGVTFQNYLRASRVGQAFEKIKEGEKVIHAAYQSGYESLSGFTDSFKKTTGFPPKESKENLVILSRKILTPLGPMIAGASNKGICLLEFTDRVRIDKQLQKLEELFQAKLTPGESSYLDKLENQLQEYFQHKRTDFSLPLDIPGSPFQKKVWQALQKIPYGETRSYQEQAELINNPKAIRALGKANGDNRIAIIIPCHRVIGKKGDLRGYAGGLWRKKYLLEWENEG